MMQPDQICQLIRKRTQTKFGKPLTPQLFRHAAATSIAIEDPEHVRMSVSILGHSSLATAERYYNLASSVDAIRRYQQVLLACRNPSRRRR
jgi:integrase